MFDGNRIELLENGAEFFPALCAEIERAQVEVYLETYIFEPDPTGDRVADALCRAARRGVAVQVLVDGFGGRAFVERMQSRLEAAGVSVLVYRPEIRALTLRRHRLRRLHRKLASIDARVVFVGGINIIDDIPRGGPPQPRFDYSVRIVGPLVRPVVESMRRLWSLVSWVNLKRRLKASRHARIVDAQAGSVRAAFLIRDNLAHRRDIEDAYLQAIGRARHEIVIACAYFFPGRRFRQALIDARQRGVSVTLLLQGLADHPMLAHATRALYPYFLGAGIRLFEYHRSYLHAKVAVIDDTWATVGSSNIDPFSLLLAREANVVIRDQGFAVELRGSLERAMHGEGTQELRQDDWGRLPTLRRLATWFAYQFVRLAIGLAGFRGKH